MIFMIIDIVMDDFGRAARPVPIIKFMPLTVYHDEYSTPSTTVVALRPFVDAFCEFVLVSYARQLT